MAMRTIQCALSAPEEVRRKLWFWSQKQTLLINDLLEKVVQDSNFPKWQKAGALSSKYIDQEWLKDYKKHPDYADLPGLLFTSVNKTICQIYKSWFAVQKKNQRSLEGKQKWLEKVRPILSWEESGVTFDQIQTRATQWLSRAKLEISQTNSRYRKVFSFLNGVDSKRFDSVDQLAVALLLVNRCRVPKKPVDLKKVRLRYQDFLLTHLQQK